jgi:eukaryotic-like serine/threonine-protein kinase
VEATRTLRGPGAPPAGAPHAAALSVLDRYRLERRLGAGAFGAVWLARDEVLQRPVAVKVVPRPEGPRGAAGETRAQREALAAARLNHPAIVTLYEAGADEEAHYLVSELVSGITLARALGSGALSDRDVVRIGIALCDALEHAHSCGVVHRDIKPQNVMIPTHPQSEAGVAKLTDFGVARLAGEDALTNTGDVVGTLAYMAPEQAEGRRVDGAADLYSLALVAYEALAGYNPVRAGGPAATARRVGRPLPPLHRVRRGLPVELTAAIDCALAAHAPDRGSLHDLREALESALGSVSNAGATLLAPPAPARPAPRWLLRLGARLLPGLAAGGLAALALLLPDRAAPVPVALAAGAVAAAVFLLPRLGWLLGAGGLVGWLAAGPASAPRTAALVASALVLCPLLLPGRGRLWSLPAAAPILGLAGLAVAFPALAGQARRIWDRAALGALGFWWLVVAEPVVARTLLHGEPHGTGAAGGWRDSGAGAVRDVLVPLAGSGVLAGALLWAAAAVVLPWLVRGRGLAAGAGALVWAGLLLAGAQAIGVMIEGSVARPHPPEALVAAALGGLAAGLLAAVRARRSGPGVA